MCGFIGVAAPRGRPLSVSDSTLVWMRDLIAHRGVDDAGLWHGGHVAFGHRRLAIVDAAHGAQPWVLGEGESTKALNYNGQLYNWRELRETLREQGIVFRTDSDTEVVARALEHWGQGALPRFRGMFALSWYDARNQRLLLARDQLGIKPLYYATATTEGGLELVFGSEPNAVLAHPSISMQPDWVTLSSYLSTIRTTLGHRTLFEGLSILEPGEFRVWDLKAPNLPVKGGSIPLPEVELADDYAEASEQLRYLLQESVQLHLMGDDDPSAFLSGGLDSSIISVLAAENIGQLNTFAASTAKAHGHGEVGQEDDGAFAELMAKVLGSRHTRVDVGGHEFRELWGWMIQGLGVPLSTPNEVAIFAISMAAAEQGKVVLSGEGADELFAGYGPPLNRYAQYLNAGPAPTVEGLANEYLRSVSWISPEAKWGLLNRDVYNATEQDQALLHELRTALTPESGASPDLRTVLNAQRRFNLTGLLGRLDTATMLASIEGRTPFADARVAAFADALPMDYLFKSGADDRFTKRILRDAFAERLPGSISYRPKASFPLPFQHWLNEQSHWLSDFPVAREVFRPVMLAELARNPNGNWLFTWPLMNLAYWLEWHWGSGRVARAA
ncbi:MAG: asparagine synthase (glutamine-hydrolyzing) [Gammaproteobacteria bacterium]